MQDNSTVEFEFCFLNPKTFYRNNIFYSLERYFINESMILCDIEKPYYISFEMLEDKYGFNEFILKKCIDYYSNFSVLKYESLDILIKMINVLDFMCMNGPYYDNLFRLIKKKISMNDIYFYNFVLEYCNNERIRSIGLMMELLKDLTIFVTYLKHTHFTKLRSCIDLKYIYFRKNTSFRTYFI
jgi:hypothetical protein